MAGIYGDLLAAFPEQFQTVEYFEKEPRVGAGYDTVTSGLTDVIIQPEKIMTLMLGKNTSSASNDVLSAKDKEYIWAGDDTPLKVGMYIKDEEGTLCTITGKADWSRYSGFYRFDFEIVQGSTGEEERPSAKPKVGKF